MMNKVNVVAMVETNNAHRLLHEQQMAEAAAAARQQSHNIEDTAPDTGVAIYNGLGHVLTILQGGSKPPEDWKAEEIEIEVRLGMIVTGSRRLYGRYEKNKSVLSTGENFRKDAKAIFQAGIDESFARQLRHRLLTSTKEFISQVQPTEIVYCSASNTGKGNKRYLLIEDNREEGKKIFKEEEKSRMLDLQLAMLSFDYDLRICGAKERSRDTEITVLDGNNQTIEGERFVCDRTRTKKRITFYRKFAARLWRIDFTEVITTPLTDSDDNYGSSSHSGGTGSNKHGEIEYELEFEMEPNVKMEWINEKNPERLQKMTSELVNSLLSLVNMLIPSHANHANMKFEKHDILQGNSLFSSIKQVMINMNANTKENTTMNKLEFLGSMPINLYRKSFKNVQNTDYYMTEKTDGIRYLLYTLTIDTTNYSVLLNRDCLISTIPGGEIITKYLGAGCIFDGEIVFNVTLERYVFLIFDVLLIGFDCMITSSFSNRLDALNNFLNDDVLNEIQQDIDIVTNNKGIVLKVKRYFTKNEITDLIGCFQIDTSTAGNGTGERYFTDVDGKKSHLTDGIIFQPALLPYEFGRCYDLYKWKWSDMRSVDLGVAIVFHPQKIDDADTKNDHLICGNSQSITNQNIHLWCAKGGTERIDCTKRGDTNVGLGKFDTFRLMAEYDDRRKNVDKSRPIIAEVCYDTHIGMWSYIKIREDKSAPNGIDAVMGVFTEQAEAIGIEELEYSLIASEWNEEQDFGDMLEKCKQEILKLQRNKKRRSDA